MDEVGLVGLKAAFCFPFSHFLVDLIVVEYSALIVNAL